MNTRITIWAYGLFAEIAQEGILQYKKVAPDVFIDIVEFSSQTELRERINDAFQHETEFPNIAILNTYDLQGIIKYYSSRIIVLNSRLEFSDFLEYSMEQVTVNGRIYGIPYAMDPIALYYKCNILDYNNENLTWENVREINETLLSEGKCFMPNIYNLAEILLQSSGHYFYDDDRYFNSEGIRETFEMIESLRDNGIFYYRDENYNSLLTNDVASIIGLPYLINTIIDSESSANSNEWRAAKIPKNDYFCYDVCLGGYAWVIFPKEREELKKTIEFASRTFIENTNLDWILADNHMVPAKMSVSSNLNDLDEIPCFDGQHVIKFLSDLLNDIPSFYHDKYTDEAAALLNGLAKKDNGWGPNC